MALSEVSQKRFQKHLFVFILPLLLIAGCFELVLWEARETWAVTRAIEHQGTHRDALFLRGIFDQAFYPYKYRQIIQRRPRILVLGSSRVMQFRSEMFGASASDFFNAGGMIQDLGDLRNFTTRFINSDPTLVILGLDLWWFNGNLPLSEGFQLRGDYDAATDWQAHLKVFRRLKSAKTLSRVVKSAYAENENIGSEARGAQAGFRFDGSMHYNFHMPQNSNEWVFVDREKPAIADRIHNASDQFVPQSEQLDERLKLLSGILDDLKSKEVLVVGFLPPISSESANLLANSRLHSNLWQSVHAQIPNLFAARNLPFFDASLTANLDLNDSCMVDGIHAAETFHVYLLLKLLDDSRLSRMLPGLQTRLRRILISPLTNPWLPDYGAAP